MKEPLLTNERAWEKEALVVEWRRSWALLGVLVVRERAVLGSHIGVDENSLDELSGREAGARSGEANRSVVESLDEPPTRRTARLLWAVFGKDGRGQATIGMQIGTTQAVDARERATMGKLVSSLAAAECVEAQVCACVGKALGTPIGTNLGRLGK
ncbi:unnamed protein product [Ilex paraguariensis]|uniref:Uncharacterized protein n=1 Tax=Ilex paraguariensis TaxID=185542 RepID=A0ABC8TTF6_9AQUA